MSFAKNKLSSLAQIKLEENNNDNDNNKSDIHAMHLK